MFTTLCVQAKGSCSPLSTHTTLGFRLRGFVSVRCRRAQRRRGPGRCCLLPAKPPEVGDEADVHVPLHLLRQRRQDLHCVTGLQFSRNRTRTTYFGCLARARYRFGDAAQDGLWHEAQGRRQDAGDGDLQVAPHPAPAAPAPVGVQRPAHAEVEAGWRVADVQPPQLPLRLYKYKVASINARSCRCRYTMGRKGRRGRSSYTHDSEVEPAGAVPQLHDDDGAHGEEEELQRQHVDLPFPLHNNPKSIGFAGRAEEIGRSVRVMRWLIRTSPTRWLLLSSGNMARNTRARSWMYSSKETCTRARRARRGRPASVLAPIHIYPWPHSQRMS